METQSTPTLLETFTKLLETIDGYVWGIPLILLIILGGLFLTIRLGGMQFIRLPLAMKYMLKNEKSGKGEVSSFAALCTALSATIGTGNIVGVATAVISGGPGALFWMWLAALLGMATKYSEGLLAIKYRTHDPKTNHVLGGPFYYIERGMGSKWIWLAKFFAFAGVLVGLFGIGTFSQVNSINTAVNTAYTTIFANSTVPTYTFLGAEYTLVTIISSIIIALLVGLVVIGGIQRIGKVSEKVIPFMVILYLAISILLIVTNITKVDDALVLIFKSAFGLDAAAGGMLGAMIVAMQKGVARGIFSNEAGLGSAPIAAAAAQTNEPVRQGLVSMTGTFLDTIIVCSMTGLALVMTGAYDGAHGQGAQATMYAFNVGLPFFSKTLTDTIIAICMILFGFTTILGWNYYSERCLEYLTKGKMGPVLAYRWMYIIAVFIGPYMTISAVWVIADIFNGIMALPNMIALFALSGVIVKETRDYFERKKRGEIIE
ncbi:MAG: alanine:cation symporter family protein [Kiritimatiellae bacterium]|nr:alanine:cation symporter family protein [Kiritimatiellia bacterium]